MQFDDYETFTPEQIKILEKYVTSTSGNIFVLRNLPEVIKGALFSRYSRSTLGLRSLLLKEFISNEQDTAFASIAGDASSIQDQTAAIKKAQNFYDRILDGYGDDSIGELGGAHVAIENVSLLAAKYIQDSRIGGSPLEKSTRYVYFDQKFQGEYLFYRDPVLMTSAYRDLYITTANMLFDTYSRLIPPLTALIGAKMPKAADVPQGAYQAALRAKVLDCLRGLLPAATLTNMGMFGNGRFFEQLINKMHVNTLAEMQEIGGKLHVELAKVIPSFVRRSDLNHHSHQAFAQFFASMQTELKAAAERNQEIPSRQEEVGVRLISYDSESVIKVAASLLFAHSNKSLTDLWLHCKHLPEEEILRILDAGCGSRENRRQKSPRALEHASFTFEIIADFGVYRDLHRHRTLTQERQQLSCDYGYYVPKEIAGTELEADYILALQKAKDAYDALAKELPEEAQYIVPQAYNIRWYFHVNLRALQWLTELRSASAGHPGYRRVAQLMAKQVGAVFPSFERFLKFVDYEGYELGRLQQEIKQEIKQERKEREAQ